MNCENIFSKYNSLLEYIENNPSNEWSSSHQSRTFASTYNEVKTQLADTVDSVEAGAMINEINEVLKKCKEELEKIDLEKEGAQRKIAEIFNRDMTIFLNDHGRKHLDKVAEKAFEIISNYSGNGEPISSYEAFILICAIEIHDIGNILGRDEHEVKSYPIFEEKCKNVVDTVDRRAIEQIAQSHGGKSPSGNKDTISSLRYSRYVYGSNVRYRLLAAILRFADELADDRSRSNRAGLDLDIIGTNSKIYHKYSESLQTVLITKDDNSSCTINLVYDIDVQELKNKYKVLNKDKFLLDEIYDRTLKMERERRYCAKYLTPYVCLDRIKVEINIFKGSFCAETIGYTLEDLDYPEYPISGNIKEIVGEKILSGQQEFDKYFSKGA